MVGEKDFYEKTSLYDHMASSPDDKDTTFITVGCILHNVIHHHPTSLLPDYSRFFNDILYNDFKIEIGTKIIHVSKLLLAQQSVFFKEFFQNESCVVNGNSLRLSEDTSSAIVFEGILKFLYTGIFPDMDESTRMKWQIMSERYGFTFLKVR